MILEVYDVIGQKRAVGYTQPLPPGVTLLAVLEHDERVKQIVPSITMVKINGQVVTDWHGYCPQKEDRISLDIVAHYAEGVIAAIQIIIAVVSVVSFIVSIFTKPKSPKDQRGAQPSSTYNFEGLQDTIAPGDVIPVPYGEHRKGGQLLMYYLTMLPNNAGLAMSMLLSMGEGPVHSINDIELNEIGITRINSVTVETRLGTSSQSVIPGFEAIKNTFHDGREISDEIINQTSPHLSSIIYRTVSHVCKEAELFVAALQGLTCIGKSRGTHYQQSSTYQIEYKDASLSDAAAWNNKGVRTLVGQFETTYWDSAKVVFPYAARWDLRLTWLTAACHPNWANPGLFSYRIWLQDVTEIGGDAPSFNNEALMAIKAAPNRTIHGGRPNATGIVKGRVVEVNSTLTTVTTIYTQNPAWPVADYLTNSRYGAGAHITRDELDIQSFMDFAVLADSLAIICPQKGCVPDPQTLQSVQLIGSEALGDEVSWSHVTAQGTGEIIMLHTNAGIFDEIKYIYRCENGACTSVAVGVASATLGSNLRNGVSDRHSFYGVLTAGTFFHYDEQVSVFMSTSGMGLAPGFESFFDAWTMYGNYAYGGALHTNSNHFILKVGAFDGLNRFPILSIGSGAGLNALHHNGNYLYALKTLNGSISLLKIDTEEMEILDTFLMTTGIVAIYAEPDDLIYYARQAVTGTAMQIGYLYAKGPSASWSMRHISSVDTLLSRNAAAGNFVLHPANLGGNTYFYYGSRGSAFEIDKIGALICTTVA